MEPSSARSARGFTLIEILIVMGIMVTLTALIAMGMGIAKEKARQKATRALISKIKIALESYHSEFRDFPPDGYDPGELTPLGMKGTSALIYYLCRPLNKITYVGAGVGVDPTDTRNQVKQRVGPFLELSGQDFSRPDFNPNMVFEGDRGTAYWETQGYKFTEIIDSYGRPLCYDKVKTNQPAHWKPALFHMNVDAHPDKDYIGAGKLGIIVEEESDQLNPDELEKHRPDPRFKAGKMEAWVQALNGLGSFAPATIDTHEPKYVGGYDLWSTGRSWTNPTDDITSWGE